MAEPSHLDPYPSDIDPSLFSCDPLPSPSQFLLGDHFDLDLDIDFDFSVDDFFRSVDDLPSPPSDASPNPGPGDGGDGSGISSPSCSPPHHQSSDLSHNSKSSGPASPDSGQSSVASGVVDRDVKLGQEKSLKRKKDVVEGSFNSCLNKIQRSEVVEGEGDDKRKTRLMRNRESAQLSRQRKKQYVEELEDKVRSMHSVIKELNAKISCVMAENASLRQQLGGSNASPAVYPPLGPVPPMHFPWIPGYALMPQGAQVPLVPIPRLKPQQPVPAPRAKKSGSKTKKVASVSLLGLLFIILASGIAPGFHFYLGTRNDIDITGSQISSDSGARVLSVSGRSSDGLISTGSTTLEKDGNDWITGRRCQNGKAGQSCPGPDVFTHNNSEALPALLYVPRNGKHVKIDGNLIIHSVLAGEKATAQAKEKQSSIKEGTETALALVGSMMSKSEGEVDRTNPDNKYGNNFKSTSVDGPLQQWFREGMAGPILSSGMCTEVFQFEVSPTSSSGIIPAAAIVNATSIVNATENLPSTSSQQGKLKNRRIMYRGTVPLNGTTMNNTRPQFAKPSKSHNSANTKPVSSVVVSVLADPKEAGNGDVDGMISPKSISRIFVVVLLDSVKYVTYSCVLPFKSSAPIL
ncbi:bZIP transcription factor 17 [Canna indica]|uniref:BZIP transcription factor 17 n=1 Tax=Canna indica TaxID=4628 RepID=A0AAQ3KDP4_9LILI|nr:bZIP transcription factor 17 [Canna indica]